MHDVILEERAGGRYEERMTVKGEEYHLLGGREPLSITNRPNGSC